MSLNLKMRAETRWMLAALVAGFAILSAEAGELPDSATALPSPARAATVPIPLPVETDLLGGSESPAASSLALPQPLAEPRPAATPAVVAPALLAPGSQAPAVETAPSLLAPAKRVHVRAPVIDALKCGGIEVDEIDLSDQFAPTVDQRESGMCYAYGALGPVEAAIWRRDGVKRSFSPRFASVLHGSKRLSADEIKRRRAAARGDADKVGGYYDSGAAIEVAQEALDTEDLVDVAAEEGNLFDTLDRFQKQDTVYSTEAERKELGRMGRAMYRLMNSESDDSAAARKVRESEEKFLKAIRDRYKVQIALYDLKVAKLGTAHEPAREGECKGLRHLETAKRIVRSLCAGAPVAAAYLGHGLNTSEDGGSTWSVDPRALAHTMTITGVRRAADGTPEFVLRNSWAAGDSAQPHRSVATVPVDMSCRLAEPFTVRGPGDPDSEHPKFRCAKVGKKIRCTTEDGVDPARLPASSGRPRRSGHGPRLTPPR